MDDFTVAGTGFRADGVMLLQNQHFPTGLREEFCHCETDNTRANHDGLDLFQTRLPLSKVLLQIDLPECGGYTQIPISPCAITVSMTLGNSGNRQSATVITVCGAPSGGLRRTFAANLAIALTYAFRNVACVSQGPVNDTIEEFLARRRILAAEPGASLATPTSIVIDVDEGRAAPAAAEQKIKLASDLSSVVIFDCADPFFEGTGQALNHADIILTTIAENQAALHDLADFDNKGLQIFGPSRFSAAVFEGRKKYNAAYKRQSRWHVLSQPHRAGPRSREREKILADMGRRFGFQLTPGVEHKPEGSELIEAGLTWFDRDREEVIDGGIVGLRTRNEMYLLLKAIALIG